MDWFHTISTPFALKKMVVFGIYWKTHWRWYWCSEVEPGERLTKEKSFYDSEFARPTQF